jgi:hypothetical protein
MISLYRFVMARILTACASRLLSSSTKKTYGSAEFLIVFYLKLCLLFLRLAIVVIIYYQAYNNDVKLANILPLLLFVTGIKFSPYSDDRTFLGAHLRVQSGPFFIFIFIIIIYVLNTSLTKSLKKDVPRKFSSTSFLNTFQFSLSSLASSSSNNCLYK